VTHSVVATWALGQGLTRLSLGLAARLGEPLARMMVDPQVRRDPYPYYARMHRRGPVHTGRFGYVVTGHEAVSAVLRSDRWRVGVQDSRVPWFMRRSFTRAASATAFDPLASPSLLATNAPDHTRYRRLVAKVFTPRAVTALEPRLERICAELLDELAGAREVDVVERYARRLPVTAISEILGVPAGMRDDFLRWGEELAPSVDIGLGLGEHRRVESGLASLNAWMLEHIRALRAEPGDDMLSRLIQVEDGGARLSDHELLATAGLLLVAGFETTVNLIGSGTHLLLTHPEERERLAAEPERWGNAVEEMLRYESPVQNTARAPHEDVEVHGVRIPERSFVAVVIGAANRDPARFADPDRFDVARENARDHLAFSAGAHYCLGANLARAEGRIGLRALFERFPAMALAGEPTLRRNRTLRGLATLPVTPVPRRRRRATRRGAPADAPPRARSRPGRPVTVALPEPRRPEPDPAVPRARRSRS
jgi:cytochrome P450